MAAKDKRSVNMQRDLTARLEERAETEGVSVSSLIARFCETGLSNGTTHGEVPLPQVKAGTEYDMVNWEACPACYDSGSLVNFKPSDLYSCGNPDCLFRGRRVGDRMITIRPGRQT